MDIGLSLLNDNVVFVYRDVLELMRDKQSELPFVLHTATMAILGLLLYNVEVSTRILFSSTPFLYLYLARVIVIYGDESLTDISDGPLFSIVFRFWSSGTIGRIVLLYFGGYFLLGTVLFANF